MARSVLVRFVVDDIMTTEDLLRVIGVARHIQDIRVLDEPVVLAVGDPFDGLSVLGPYESTEEAEVAADADYATWWVVPLAST